MPHILRTKRLLLRRPRLRDAKDLAVAVNDRAVLRNTGTWVFPASEEYARCRIRKSIGSDLRDGCYYVIDLDDTVIGHISVWRRLDELFEIGYMIGKPWWGQGIATEAVGAICLHAFRVLPVGQIVGGVFDDNPGSVRVLMKTGFVYAGPSGPTWSIVRQRFDPGSDYILTRERLRP